MAFSLFSSLPSELRIQIWHYALTLPEKRQSLVPYRKGCWKVPPSPSNERDPDEIPLVFYHNLLDNIQVEIPLFFVSHEARDVALSWIRKHNIRMCFSDDKQSFIFTRQFDPRCDVLYVPPDKKRSFLNEHWDKTRETGIQFVQFTTEQHLTCVAIPEALLHKNSYIICDIFENLWNPKVLFIILDTQPDFEDNDTKVQQQWKLESFQGMSLSWDYKQRKFEWKTGNVIDEALHKLIEEAIKYLDEALIDGNIISFEIRPVLAVKRSMGLSDCSQQEK